MDDGGIVGWLVSRTTFSGHLRADAIRMVAASIPFARSGNLSGSFGGDQPIISRRAASAPPTTAKYLAMGRADGSGNFANLDLPITAMLGHSRAARHAMPPLEGRPD
jgi:hypothetical protein